MQTSFAPGWQDLDYPQSKGQCQSSWNMGLFLRARTSLQKSGTIGLPSLFFWSVDFDLVSVFFQQRQVALLRIKSSESVNLVQSSQCNVLFFPDFSFSVNLELLSQEHFLFFLE